MSRLISISLSIGTIVLLVLLFVSSAVASRTQDDPDPRIEATFQPLHQLADLHFNDTRPTLTALANLLRESSDEVETTVASSVLDNNVPEGMAIYRALHKTVGPLEAITRNVDNNFRFRTTEMVTLYHREHRAILLELKGRQDSGKVQSDRDLRQMWLFTATHYRFAELVEVADGIIDDLEHHGQRMWEIVRWMDRNLQAQADQSKELYAEELARYAPSGSAIQVQAYRHESAANSLGTYLGRIYNAKEAIMGRRDLLLAASQSLAALEPSKYQKDKSSMFSFLKMSSSDIPRFGQRNLKSAESLVRHMEAVLDCEEWVSGRSQSGPKSCHDGWKEEVLGN
ncbi:hypothetical protein PG993_010525 [Apiospora rasikravindrae]|uniref:Uncharacterized protein n=1 Tax=Apiospora rasikravindrae TaxID=990691 RepID=A0ABR1SMI4_9PEZI